MDPTILLLGAGAVVAAGVGAVRLRPRLTRERREPIDLELMTIVGDSVVIETPEPPEPDEVPVSGEVAADAAISDALVSRETEVSDEVPAASALADEPDEVADEALDGEPTGPAEPPAALEDELRRVALAPAAPDPVLFGSRVDRNASIAPESRRSARDAGSETAMTTTPTTPTRTETTTSGLPPDQVRAWLEQVQDDLRRVRARLEFLRTEQARLEAQQRLLAELLASGTASV